MPVSSPLNELSKLALVASDASYFSADHPVAVGSALAPLDEGDPTVIPRFNFQSGFFARKLLVDSPRISTGFKAIAYEKGPVGNPAEVVLAFGGSDGGPLGNPTDWVSNTQHLGWNQWDANKDQIFEYLNGLAPDTKITFTGQSLGGALAQYAAYDWVRSKTTPGLETYDSAFDKSRISLITFNALGGYVALNDPTKGGGYSASILTGINTNLSAHYVITGDLVSRLGGDPTTGVGHVGGQLYLLDYRTVNPNTGALANLDLVESHRIETGFYAGLHAGDAFSVGTPLFQNQSPHEWYFQMASLQNTAGLLGNILNGRDVSRAESYPRLLAGLMAGMTFGDQHEWDAIMKAYLANQHDAGKLSDATYTFYSGAVLPVAVAGKPATAAIYAASAILAGLADALGLGLDVIQIGLSILKQYLQVATGPAEPTSISQGELSQKVALVLAATGALGSTHALRQEFLSHNLSPEDFIQELLSHTGDGWREAALTYLGGQLSDLTDKVQAIGLTVDFYDTLSAGSDLSLSELTTLAQERDAFITETGSAFANANPDFSQKIAHVAVDLGRTIHNVVEALLIDTAWASELNDPRLSSSARAAIEEARETFQHAAQTVVIQTGMGTNPFHTPGFIPGGLSSATMEEQLGEMFRLSLPFAAGEGGQRIALQLQGPQADQLSIVTDEGVQAVGANGTVEVLVPEGADQLRFTLVSSNGISADTTVTLSATLVDLNGTATHTPQMESTIEVKAYVEPTDGRYHTTVEDYSWITDPEGGVPMGAGGLVHQTLIGGAGSDYGITYPNGFGDDTLYGNGGDDFLYAERGHDVLYGGTGNDTLVGDNIDDKIDQPWQELHPEDLFPDPRGTQDGMDFLDGGEGNDRLGGGGSDDRLIGGTGDDVLWGDVYTPGKIVQYNPDGTYIIQEITGVLHPGDDVLEGGGGNDFLSGDSGDDLLDGGEGNDIMIGDTQLSVNATLLYPTTTGDDFLTGGVGDDVLYGNAGEDVLLGGAGNDQLFGDDDGVSADQQGDDWLEGGDGADLLIGRGGADILIAGAGADVLFGGDGHDVLIGNEDDDVGFAGEGDDRVQGGAGADQFDGEAGDDVLLGDDGNDLLIGGAGIDHLDGGDGHDQLSGGDEADSIFGGAGDDELQGNAGTDLLAGDADEDRVFGQEGDDQIFGGDGNDSLRGDDGNDDLHGGAGDDILVGDTDGQVGGSGGNDILIGGTGNDTLVGGGGQDTYRYDSGDGFDVIVEAAGEGNRLVFGAGISSSIIIAATGPNDSLILRTGNGDDAVQVLNFGTTSHTGSHPIDSFEFADGVILTYGQLAAAGLAAAGGIGNDVLTGTAQSDRVFGGLGNDVINAGPGSDIVLGGTGNDLLEGDAGDDVLVGGAGNDQINGGDGSDTYRFNLGDGVDFLLDSGSSTDTDIVIFGHGIVSNALVLKADSGQVLLKVGTGLDGISTGSTFDVLGSQTIEGFQFANGSTIAYVDLVARGFDIDGTSTDDVLFGTNVVDRFHGGPGSDRLQGGDGNDTYFFNVGDGIDTIVDMVGLNTSNEVVFGLDIVSTSLRLDLAPDQFDPSLSNLLIRVGTNGDAIQLDIFDRENVLRLRTAETFRFADGSRLTYEELLARGFALTGTLGADQITGTNVADQMVGLLGSDVLRGGEGDDQLDGGADHDRLFGGDGSDTYIFGSDFGHDVIIESQGSLDRIRLAPGVVPADLAVTRTANDLVLSLNGGADELTISSYFLNSSLQIEQVLFADGTVWDQTILNTLAEPMITGTSGSDVLVGTANHDRLAGLAGDDQLTGLAGHDVLDGGPGSDQLVGGPGNETYVVGDAGDVVTELTNEGIDTIQSSITRTLEADVENLTLTGTAAINGTGNALDNVLRGNSAANVLTGGLGDDTYVVGAGDIVVELMGEGADTVQADGTFTLADNLENLVLTGSASLIGIGNSLDNVLQANGSISVLAGGDGNDTYMIGPNGDDDILVETVTGGIDTVIASKGYRLPGHIENLVLMDSPIPDTEWVHGSLVIDPNVSGIGIGNDLNNTLRGSRTANVLDGGAGADTLIGSLGDDTYVVDNGGDQVVEQANEGIDTVQTSVSFVLPEYVESLILTGRGAINGTGNARNNTILGNDAENVLDGRAGNDILNGEEGADTFLFGVGFGQDVVADMTQTGAVDTVLILANLTPDDLGVFQRDGDVVLSVAETTDELILENFYGASEWGFKQVRFADGTLWSAEDLRTRAVVVGGAVNGTMGDDTLLGGFGHDVVVGDAGNDTLTGGQGNDFLYGDGQTNNLFFPIIGNDTLLGGLGNDVLRDFHGTNLFDGGPGNDTLYMGDGQDTVVFSRGSGGDFVVLDHNESDLDVIQFAAAITPHDVVLSREYLDYHIIHLLIPDSGETLTVMLSTNVGLEAPQAVVRFADGTQWMLVWSPSDLSFATGTVLDDVVSGGSGEVLRGLAGDDTYLVEVGSGIIVEQADEGTDTVQSRVDYTLPLNVEKLILAETHSSVFPNPVSGMGNELDNLIVGNTGDNILDGSKGNDLLIGGYIKEEEVGITQPGSDMLIGGDGDDVLISVAGFQDFLGNIQPITSLNPLFQVIFDDLLLGGTGNDTYVLHSQQETVVESAGEGTDTVQASVSYVLGEYVENLTLIGTGNLNGTGNGLANVLSGNEDDNVLAGREGEDTLWGGSALGIDSYLITSGNDMLIGGAGNDTYVFNLGDGADTIDDVALPGEGNVVIFGNGIIRSALSFSAGSVIIHVGTGGDQLHLLHSNMDDPTGMHAVDLFRFADGTELTYAELLGGSTVNHAPTVANPLVDQTVEEDGPLTLQVPASTFEEQDVGDTLTYSATFANGTALPSWLTFDAATHMFSGTPDDAQVGSYELRVTVLDTDNLSASDVFTLTVTNVNEAPTVATPLTDQATLEDMAFSFTVPVSTFSDHDVVHGDTLMLSASRADGTALPSWLAFDAVTRTFSGMPDNADVGSLNVKVTATDSGNLTVSHTVTVTVENVNDAPTVVAPLVNQTMLEDTLLSFVVPTNTFTDQDAAHGDTLTYSVSLTNGSSLPTWLSFNEATCTFGGTPLNGDVGNLSITVTARDRGGLSATSLFTLTVQNVNDAPILSTPLADQEATPGTELTVDVQDNTFADVDVGDTLTYSAMLANGTALPAWLTFNATNKTFRGIPTTNDVGLITIQLTATDTGNLSAVDVFDLRVISLDQTLTGTGGNDVLTGAIGNDQLFGLGGNDTLTGLAGDDFLDGGTGIDRMTGNTGNDTYAIDSVSDVVIENANEGSDTVQSVVTYTLGANLENLTLMGTTAINGTGNSLDNVLIGNSAANVLAGGAGHDTYVVEAGDTVMEGATGGMDTVQSSVSFTLGANVENLTLVGTATINGTGNILNNTLVGNSAANVLNGGVGADSLAGGAGDDIYVVDHVRDVVTENQDEGTDLVRSSTTYTLGEHVENLTLIGTSAINGNGNELDNVLVGNSAANVLTGGAGSDTYIVGASDTVVETADHGIDTVQSSVTQVLTTNVEHLTLTGTAAINATGNSLDNVLIGNSAANLLDGGVGEDHMAGGAGNDTYVVDNEDDTVIENLGGGIDRVQSSVTYALSSNMEHLTLTGTAAINGTGNELDNKIIGNSGNNVLDGGSGADAMSGGAGDDAYVVDNLSDTVVEGTMAGTDRVQSSVSFTLGANVENLTLVGTATINGTGNILNNTLVGNSAANVLNGGVGADSLAGGAGDDIYVVDHVRDVVTENQDEGTDLVRSSTTYTLGEHVENLTLIGTSAINGNGNELDNVLVGNSAANVLTGGAGSDTYIVGASDTVVETADHGIDTVQSSVTQVLTANVEYLTLTGTAAINGTGNSLDNVLTGNGGANLLTGGDGNDTLRGKFGNDTLNGGSGNDVFLFGRGDGQDVVQDANGISDRLQYDSGINPLDLVISRQASNLRLTIHGSTDAVIIQNWYVGTTNRMEMIQAGNGQTLLSTQVDQLIQAMAGFTQQSGLSWDQAIDQRPEAVQAILAATWQS